jgi:hypothetical protein
MRFDKIQQNSFIENLLFGMPILDGIKMYDDYILDGNKQLNCVLDFLNNKFKLHKCVIFGEYNGCYFSDLPKNIQRKIENIEFNIFVIYNCNDSEMKLINSIKNLDK